MKGTLDVVSFSTCMRQPDKHDSNKGVGRSAPKQHQKRDRKAERERRTRVSPLTGQPKRNRDFAAPILDTYTAPPIGLSPDDIPLNQRKQLLDLKESDCRWPYGDVGKPDFFFCGAHAEEGGPYCGEHFRVAYQPSGDRRRDRRPGA